MNDPGPMVWMSTWTLAVLALLLACNRPNQHGDSDDALPQPVRAQATSSTTEKLLRWLDPDASAMCYMRRLESLDLDTLAVVFAVPPRPAKLMRDAFDTWDDLRATLGPGAPDPSTWLSADVLVMQPRTSLASYAVRALAVPRSEVERMLGEAGMTSTVMEGLTMYVPRGAFPWKLVFLDDDVLGFVPIKAVAAPLNPFTAGRDLPPSQLETELVKALESDPDDVLELYAEGPFLHMDLDQDVEGVRFSLRRWQGAGLDGVVKLQIAESPDGAVTQLAARKAGLETDVVQDLMHRVAFVVEGPMVQGRLQLTPQDVHAIVERR